MTRLTRACITALPAFLLGAALQAGAQDGPAATTTASAASSQARQGSLVVERIRDTFVITPDVKVTELDHSTRTLVGAYGGLLKENTLLLGAGGYWLADHSRNREMAYGGFVAQWTRPVGGALRVGVRGLAGGGRATLPRTVSFAVPTGYGPFGFMGPGFFDRDRNATFTTTTRTVRFHTGFVVAEPQADVLLQITSWLAINAGAGYRAIGWADGLERQLRGAVGSVGLRIGKSS